MTWIMPLSEAICCQIKSPFQAGCPWSEETTWRPKTLQAVTVAFCFPPELDAKTLLQRHHTLCLQDLEKWC